MVNFTDFHSEFFSQLDLFHYVQESLCVRIFSDFKLFTESINNEFNQVLVINLEKLALIFYFINENLKLDSGAVFWIYKLVDNFIEFIGSFVKVGEEVSELSENELFSLPIF